jgi:hypothetical protein
VQTTAIFGVIKGFLDRVFIANDFRYGGNVYRCGPLDMDVLKIVRGEDPIRSPPNLNKMEPFIGQWPTFGNSGITKGLLSEEIPTRPGFKEGIMSRRGFPAARPIFPAAGFRGLSILTLVTLVIAWAPRCEAGSEIRPVSGMGYTVFAIGKSGDLYVAQPQAGKVSRIKMDGTRITLIEGLNEPRDPAFDEAGNLYVAETGAGRIIKMTGEF